MREDVLLIMERFAALGLSSLVLQDGSFSLSLSKEGIAEQGNALNLQMMPLPTDSEALPKEGSAPSVGDPLGKYEVRSPLVGVFYGKPAPDAEPFVIEGDRVEKGDVLCVVEAMKIYNDIPAPISGTVTHVYIEDGTAIGYDELLFEIEEDR